MQYHGGQVAPLTAPVAANGSIANIVIGDDYLAANGRAFEWTIEAPTGYVAGTSSCFFGGRDKAGTTWRVQGTITAAGNAWTLSFDLNKTDTASMLCGIVFWSVEVVSASGDEITSFSTSENDDPTLLVEKYT